MEQDSKRIRVLIADDHGLFREMLFHTLSEEEDIEVVGEAVDGKEAVEKTKALNPDIILLDINMPRLDGMEATKILRQEHPSTKIVILTAADDDELVFKLVKAGATGYLLKDTSTGNVVDAVRAAYSGESLIQPKVASKILKEFARLMDEKESTPAADGRSNKLKALTDRELEVLKLVGKGMNNREIACALYIGENTVKTHVANSMHKLEFRDRVELALFAAQSGLIND
jgi:DNA-binding NarL/FixJ family response regulator